MLKKILMFSLILNSSTYIVQATEVSTKNTSAGRPDLISFKEDLTPEQLLSHLERIINNYSISYIRSCMYRQKVNVNIQNDANETTLDLLLKDSEPNKKIRRLLNLVHANTAKQLHRKLLKKAAKNKANKEKLPKEENKKTENKDDNHEEISEEFFLEQMNLTAEQMSAQLGLD